MLPRQLFAARFSYSQRKNEKGALQAPDSTRSVRTQIVRTKVLINPLGL